jgi:predicted transposase YdaD
MMIGRRQFSESVLEAAFREELPMLKEMEFVQEWIAECRQEGLEQDIEKGREEGVLIGRIEFAGQLLGRPLPSRADLLAMRMEELQELAGALDAELRR